MDIVTHMTLGAGLSYAVAGRKLGRRAAVVGLAAGLFPDIDGLIGSREDPLLEIEFHRHFTHSLLFAPIGSLLVSLLWLARASLRTDWKPIWGCALLAYCSHCLLDASTSYGTLLFWPLTNHRFGWDLISIVDPIFTLALLMGLIVALIQQKRRWVAAGLGFAAFYLAFGGVQQQRAAHAQAQLAHSRGHVIKRTAVMPTLANNIVWRSLYLHEGRIHSDRIRVGWFSGSSLREGTSLPRVTLADLTEAEAARNGNRRTFERFAWFSDEWVARSPFDEALLGDMRYSLSTAAFDPIWGIRFTASEEKTSVEWVNRARNRKLELNSLWEEITGSHPDYHATGEQAGR